MIARLKIAKDLNYAQDKLLRYAQEAFDVINKNQYS